MMINRLADLMRQNSSVDTMVQPVRPASPIASRDFDAGAVVRAMVTAALPGGLFDVQIHDRAFVLRLPYKAEPGDELQLIVTSREPKLTFALARRDDVNAHPTRLSETAHFVTTLLRSNDKLPLAEAALARAPLLSGAGASTANIAVSLRQALTHSGIFYEAHQAEWVAGTRPLADLLQEPQARLSPLPENSERRPNEVATARFNPAAPLEALAERRPNEALAGRPNPAVPVEALVEFRPDEILSPRLIEPVHREALAIVKQQLDTLDTRHLAWNGVVWPGQTMDWEVSEQTQHGLSTPEEPHWETSLRMDLPRLGGMSAVLGITPRGVSITLLAQTAETAATMTEHSAALRLALYSAGVTPLDIIVREQRDQS
jgi:hypothetical protein